MAALCITSLNIKKLLSMFVYEDKVTQAVENWAKGKPFTDESLIKDINPNLAEIRTVVMKTQWTYSHPLGDNEIAVGLNDKVGTLRYQIRAAHINHVYDYEW